MKWKRLLTAYKQAKKTVQISLQYPAWLMRDNLILEKINKEYKYAKVQRSIKSHLLIKRKKNLLLRFMSQNHTKNITPMRVVLILRIAV